MLEITQLLEPMGYLCLRADICKLVILAAPPCARRQIFAY